MASVLKVDKLDPQSGTALEIGSSGDTITIPSGATFTQSGTMNASSITAGTVATARLGSGTASSSTILYGDQTYKAEPSGVALATSTDNQVVTVTGADAITGETNLTYNGTILGVGSGADLGRGIHIKVGESSASVDASAQDLVIEAGSGQNAGMSILSEETSLGNIYFGDSGDNDIGKISYNHDNNSLAFTSNTLERLRVDADGVFTIGQTTWNTWYRVNMRWNGNSAGCFIIDNSETDSNEANYFSFREGNTTIGKITKDGTTAAILYTTTSDYRLKENVTDKTDGIEKIKLLKPKKFSWKGDPFNQIKDGFLAHEVQEVVPGAITGVKDAIEKYKEGQELPEGKSVGDNILDENGNTIIDPQTIDKASLVPLLTSALQEAITKIETLETSVADLTTRLEVLENA